MEKLSFADAILLMLKQKGYLFDVSGKGSSALGLQF